MLALLAAGCAKEPPEAALRATIAGMQAAAEARDADALADAVSEEFVGPGGMDRDQFRRTMAVAWLRDKNVGVQLGPLDVELVGDRARVEFTAGTTGGCSSCTCPSSGGASRRRIASLAKSRASSSVTTR